MQGGNNAQVGIETRQLPLHIAELVTVPVAALAAGIRPNLEKKEVPDIWVVVLPRRRQIDPVLLVSLAAIAVVRAVVSWSASP